MPLNHPVLFSCFCTIHICQVYIDLLRSDEEVRFAPLFLSPQSDIPLYWYGVFCISAQVNVYHTMFPLSVFRLCFPLWFRWLLALVFLSTSLWWHKTLHILYNLHATKTWNAISFCYLIIHMRFFSVHNLKWLDTKFVLFYIHIPIMQCSHEHMLTQWQAMAGGAWKCSLHSSHLIILT